MIPLSKFADMLVSYKDQAGRDYDEIIMAANLIGSRPFVFTMDAQGIYYMHASGSLDECIRATEHHLEKLNRIKANREGKLP